MSTSRWSSCSPGQAAVAIANARLYEQLRNRVDAQRVAGRDRRADRRAARAADRARARRRRRRPPAPRRSRPDQPAGREGRPARAADRRGADPALAATTWSCRSDPGSPAWPRPSVACAGPATTSTTQSFPHDPGDARIEAQDIHSMMSAPLLGPDRLIGTITIQAVEPQRLRRRGCRAAPAPGRPGRHRAHQRAPVRRGRGVGAPVPAPRRQLAGHRVERGCRWQLHVLQRLARVAHRAGSPSSSSGSRSPPSPARTLAADGRRRGQPLREDPDARAAACGSTCRWPTVASRRPRWP